MPGMFIGVELMWVSCKQRTSTWSVPRISAFTEESPSVLRLMILNRNISEGRGFILLPPWSSCGVCGVAVGFLVE